MMMSPFRTSLVWQPNDNRVAQCRKLRDPRIDAQRLAINRQRQVNFLPE
jgi:hypothetical protein